MKKIFLALAAVAALASCVKENAPVLDQDNDNLVTITALATKTTLDLDGTSVVWDADDEIGVVYNINLDEIPVFSTTGSGSSVKFTGAHPDGYMETTSAYAVYPSSAVTLEYGVVKVSHNLPAEQDGTIDGEMNLSFDELDVEDLKAGSATATFKNALTLLKVIVPEGVKEVSFTSNSETLVGDAEFNAPASGAMGRKSVSDGGKTVTLTKGGSDLKGTHYLLVYPANTNGLDLRMVGSDDTVYESTAPAIKFSPSEYRTINLTEVFKMDVNATEAVSPLGGELVIPVAATEQYTYTVDIADDPSWISVKTSTYVQTKAFVGTNIVFDVDANTTGSPRSAEVTITWGTDGEETFTVTQESAYLDFVYVDPADPASGLIQWEETFGFYESEEKANSSTDALASYTNVFTISLAEGDESTYGTYKIENMLKAYFYYGEGFQENSNKGGVYYANYDAENKKLVVSMTGATKSYNNMSDITLIYDDVNKTFSAETFAATAVILSGKANPISGFIGGYTAAVKVDDPGAGGVDASVAKYIGEYVEGSFTSTYNMLTPGILKIEASDDLSKGTLKIVSIFGKTPSNMYASVSSGEIITDANATINDINGPNPIGSLTLNVNPETMNITMSDITLGGWMSISDYAAYSIVGSYVEGSFTSTYNMLTPGILKIEASDDLSKGTLKIVSIFGKTPSNMYASVSSGKIITDANAAINDINGPNPIGSLTLSYAINEGKLNITMVDTTIGGWMTVSSYTAVK